ncbi:MAG: hypothetical protein AB1529_05660 [Candidatus Micrarchaeota archaeon]
MRTLLALAMLAAVITALEYEIIQPLPEDVLQAVFLTGCPLCEDLTGYSQGEMTLTPNEAGHEMDVIFYNGTLDRTEIKNAPVVIYVYNDTENALIKTYSNGSGIARFSFDNWAGSCHDYRIFYCHATSGCSFDKCFESVGLNNTELGVSSIDDIPLAESGFPGGGAQEPYQILPTYANYRFCPPPPPIGSSTPVFCLPLIGIFTLLVGSLYLSGRNPFAAFDFSAPRMGKYIRYTARGRGFGFDLVSIASAAVTTASIAKNPKAMAEKDKAALKEGAAFGGIAAGVKGGVSAAGAGIKDVKGGWGSKFGSGGGLQMISMVGGTGWKKMQDSAIGQVVKGTVTASQSGGLAAGLKAVSMGILSRTSFAPVVQAVQTAATVWAVANGVDAARQELREWSGSTGAYKDVNDGKMKEVEAKIEEKRDATGKVVGYEVVYTRFTLQEATGPGGEVTYVRGSGERVTDMDSLVRSMGPGGLDKLASIRDSGFDQLQRYNRTVQFFVPIEITRKQEDFRGGVRDNEQLEKGASAEGGTLKDPSTGESVEVSASTQLKYKDSESGTEINVGVAHLREISESDSGIGVIVTTTTTIPSSREGEPPTVSRTTEIVSEAEFQRRQESATSGTSVRMDGQMDMSRLMGGLQESQTTRALGLGESMQQGQQIEGLKQMVAVSRDMYVQLENVRTHQSQILADQREKLLEDFGSLSTQARQEQVTIGGETKTVEDWVKAGKQDQVITTLAADPDRAPASLESFARQAYGVYATESTQMTNFGSIYANSMTFSDNMARAEQLSGTQLLAAENQGLLVASQLSIASHARLFDVSIMEGVTFEGVKQPPPNPLEVMQRPEIQAMITAAGDNPEKQQAVSERIQELCAVQVPATTEQQLTLQRESYSAARELFANVVPGDEAGERRAEKAALFAFTDMGRHPDQATQTLSLLEGLAESRNDPQRFERLYEGINQFTITHDPQERAATFQRLQVQDATDNFGDTVRIRAINSSVPAEEAFTKMVEESRSRAISAAPIGEASQSEARAPFLAVDRERSEYESARQAWFDKADTLREARTRGDSAEVWRAQQAEHAAHAQMERERDQYYQAGFRVIGGASNVDTIIREHVYPGSDERGMWEGYQQFAQVTSSSKSISDASAYLKPDAWKVADASGRPTGQTADPFKPIRSSGGDIPAFTTSLAPRWPPSAPMPSYQTDIHAEVFGNVGQPGMPSIAELKAMGVIR